MPAIEHQRGVGLIEVLIALLVLGLGMLALGRLMVVALREIESGRARGVAMQLATEKLEDLRSFAQLDAGLDSVFGFDEIGEATGGAKASDGRLLLPAGAVEIEDLRFTRHWSVRPQYLCGNEVPAVTDPCAPGRPHPDLLWITVTLSWTERSGEAATLAVEGAIAGMEPALVPQALLRPAPVPPPGA